MKRFFRPYIYPFLLGIYPVLALWNHNASFVELGSVLRALGLTLVGIVLLNALFKLVFRDWRKAGLSTTLTALLFFSYGHVFLFVSEEIETIARHRYVAAILLAIFAIALWWVVKRLGDPQGLERFLTITGILLVVFSLLQLAWYEYTVYRASVEAENRVEAGIDCW
jgi:hypothetical protein